LDCFFKSFRGDADNPEDPDVRQVLILVDDSVAVHSDLSRI
jgi:hypothetical protein